MKTIGIKTLGCKLNFSESANIERLLVAKGYKLVPFEEKADVYIINTCAVTKEAEKKCHYYARQIKSHYPNSKVAFVGCFSSLRSEQLIQNQEADIILGSNNKLEVVEAIENLFHSSSVLPLSQIEDKTHFVSAYSLHERTRSFLKIQDGCDYFCAYCTVAYARGPSRSDSIENILANAQHIVDNHIKEIILTGVNIGDFKTSKGEDLYKLLTQLAEIKGLERVRISSIEPNLLSNEIIELTAKSNQILPHFHIPLQSGSNRILHNMKRRYKREVFAEKVQYIKQLMPHACIAADVIVGFPGENENDFTETYQFIESLPISYLHIFPYSKRPGTPAYTLPEQLSKACKKTRTKQLSELSNRKKHQFYTENIGSKRSVLFETQTTNHQLSGFTDNYIKVWVNGKKEEINTIQKVHLLDFISNDTLIGEIITE